MLIATAGCPAAVEGLVPLLHNHGPWLALMLFLPSLRALTLGAWLPRLHRAVDAAAP